MGYAARNSDFGIFSDWKDADGNNKMLCVNNVQALCLSH